MGGRVGCDPIVAPPREATWPYLTLPYFTLPYLTLPYLTLPYLNLISIWIYTSPYFGHLISWVLCPARKPSGAYFWCYFCAQAWLFLNIPTFGTSVLIECLNSFQQFNVSSLLFYFCAAWFCAQAQGFSQPRLFLLIFAMCRNRICTCKTQYKTNFFFSIFW